jgi:hypothetical protein
LPVAAIAIAVIMFVGFARNYYLRTWLGTRPISFMVHVHGVVMTAWVALFLAQIALVAKRRVDLHRKLGVAGAVLAGLIVVLGVYTISISIARQAAQATLQHEALLFVAFDGLSLLLFGGFVMAALKHRAYRPTHRRLMLMAFVSLSPPALGRLVANFTHDEVSLVVLILMYSTALACVLIDSMRNRRVNPAMAWAGFLVAAVNQVTYIAQAAD